MSKVTGGNTYVPLQYDRLKDADPLKDKLKALDPNHDGTITDAERQNLSPTGKQEVNNLTAAMGVPQLKSVFVGEAGVNSYFGHVDRKSLNADVAAAFGWDDVTANFRAQALQSRLEGFAWQLAVGGRSEQGARPASAEELEAASVAGIQIGKGSLAVVLEDELTGRKALVEIDADKLLVPVEVMDPVTRETRTGFTINRDEDPALQARVFVEGDVDKSPSSPGRTLARWAEVKLDEATKLGPGGDTAGARALVKAAADMLAPVRDDLSERERQSFDVKERTLLSILDILDDHAP